MKLIIGSSIVLLFVVVTNVTTETSSEEEDKFMLDTEQCKNETGASNMDVKELIARIIPTTKPAKCLNACVLQKLGIMKEHKFVPEELMKFVELDELILKNADGKTLKDATKDIIDECKAVADAEKCECEAAAMIRICLNNAAKKRGFCPNLF